EFSVSGNFGVGLVGKRVRGYEAWAGEEIGLAKDVLLFGVLKEEAEAAFDGIDRDRFREAIDDGDFVAVRFCLAALAVGDQGFGDRVDTNSNRRCVLERARNGKH